MNVPSVPTALVLALGLLGACDDERLAPAPTSSTPEPPPTGGAGGAGGDAPTPGPRIREVFYRNPMGAPGNLLADGDVELSIVPEGAEGQHGWVAFRGNGASDTLLGETGGLCKSGVRCARVEANRVLFARGTSGGFDASHEITVHVKPLEIADPGDPCDVGVFRAISCDFNDMLGSLDEPDAPDADGWCKLSRSLNPSDAGGICVYAETEVPILLDAAELRRTDGAARSLAKPSPVPSRRGPSAAEPTSATDLERMRAFGRLLRDRTPVGRPAPTRERGSDRLD
jgi:hypothetical protein